VPPSLIWKTPRSRVRFVFTLTAKGSKFDSHWATASAWSHSERGNFERMRSFTWAVVMTAPGGRANWVVLVTVDGSTSSTHG
jgi:hypothetical protein